MLNTKNRKSGFSLLEVLVALVVLSLVFTASFTIFSLSSRNYVRLKDKTASQWVGMNVIARTKLGLIQISPNQMDTTGSDKMFDMYWDWRMAAIPTKNASVMRLTVEVVKKEYPASINKITGFMLIKKTQP